jgi:hypothetical protein
MTTICYRVDTKEMAADTLLVQSEGENTFYVGYADKIIRLKDGSLLGMSGDAEGQWIVNVLNNTAIPADKIVEELAELPCECSCLLVRPDGSMWWVSTSGDGFAEYYSFRDDFAAVGTGKQIAIGALAAGMSAKRSVEIACERHCYSKPPIQVVKLGGE